MNITYPYPTYPTQPYPYPTYPTQPCQTCGRCPACGAYRTQPYFQPYFQPYWVTTTGGTAAAPTVTFSCEGDNGC